MACFTHSSGQYLRSGDASLYFEVAGNVTGKPLVLLHGGLGNLTDFNGILSSLAERFRCIGIDLRGHGKSSLGSLPLTYRQHQSDVEAILDSLGVVSFSLLGFSDGGIVGYRMAAEHAERVDALVAVGSQYRIERTDPVFELLSGLTAEMWTELFPDAVAYYQAINPEPDFSRLVRAVVSLWTDLRSTGYPNAAIANIVVPTLVVRGDSDPFLSLREAVEIRENIAGAWLLNVPYAGNEVHKEAAGLFVSEVGKFLAAPKKRPD